GAILGAREEDAEGPVGREGSGLGGRVRERVRVREGGEHPLHHANDPRTRKLFSLPQPGKRSRAAVFSFAGRHDSITTVLSGISVTSVRRLPTTATSASSTICVVLGSGSGSTP